MVFLEYPCRTLTYSVKIFFKYDAATCLLREPCETIHAYCSNHGQHTKVGLETFAHRSFTKTAILNPITLSYVFI